MLIFWWCHHSIQLVDPQKSSFIFWCHLSYHCIQLYVVIHLVMPSVYPALDGDTTGDAWQRVQDAANGLHLHVHAVHSVHREGKPAVERGITHLVSSIYTHRLCHLVFRYFLSNDTIPCRRHRTSVSSSMFKRAAWKIVMKNHIVISLRAMWL